MRDRRGKNKRGGSAGGDGEEETLLQRLSSGAHRLSAEELDDMLERKRGTQMDQHYLSSAATLNR